MYIGHAGDSGILLGVRDKSDGSLKAHCVTVVSFTTTRPKFKMDPHVSDTHTCHIHVIGMLKFVVDLLFVKTILL